MQNGQHCSLQRALRIRRMSPVQGRECSSEGDPGDQTAYPVYRKCYPVALLRNWNEARRQDHGIGEEEGAQRQESCGWAKSSRSQKLV